MAIPEFMAPRDDEAAARLQEQLKLAALEADNAAREAYYTGAFMKAFSNMGNSAMRAMETMDNMKAEEWTYDFSWDEMKKKPPCKHSITAYNSSGLAVFGVKAMCKGGEEDHQQAMMSCLLGLDEQSFSELEKWATYEDGSYVEYTDGRVRYTAQTFRRARELREDASGQAKGKARAQAIKMLANMSERDFVNLANNVRDGAVIFANGGVQLTQQDVDEAATARQERRNEQRRRNEAEESARSRREREERQQRWSEKRNDFEESRETQKGSLSGGRAALQSAADRAGKQVYEALCKDGRFKEMREGEPCVAQVEIVLAGRKVMVTLEARDVGEVPSL